MNRVGQVWRVGDKNGFLILVIGPAQTARELLGKEARRSKMLWHPAIWLEIPNGTMSGLTEEFPGRWEHSRRMRRLA